MRAALQANMAIIARAQEILTDYLHPDGIGADNTLHRLLSLLDGPEQRAAKALSDEALKGDA